MLIVIAISIASFYFLLLGVSLLKEKDYLHATLVSVVGLALAIGIIFSFLLG